MDAPRLAEQDIFAAIDHYTEKASDHDIRVLRVLHHGRDIMSLIGAADPE